MRSADLRNFRGFGADAEPAETGRAEPPLLAVQPAVRRAFVCNRAHEQEQPERGAGIDDSGHERQGARRYRLHESDAVMAERAAEQLQCGT